MPDGSGTIKKGQSDLIYAVFDANDPVTGQPLAATITLGTVTVAVYDRSTGTAIIAALTAVNGKDSTPAQEMKAWYLVDTSAAGFVIGGNYSLLFTGQATLSTDGITRNKFYDYWFTVTDPFKS